MQKNKHILITRLAVKYADSMASGENPALFSREALAAAYIIGAVETLHRLCNIIRESAVVGGISHTQESKLLEIIDTIENTQYGNHRFASD